MTTKKVFTFDLQRFVAEISASSNNVSVNSDYAFSGSEASTADTAVDVVAYDSDTAATVQAIPGEAWINGGDNVASAVLDGVGTISSFSSRGSLFVTASGTNLKLANLTGDTLEITPAEGQLHQTINGATVNAAVASNNVVEIFGGKDASDLSKVTLSSAKATLSSIDANQTWLVTNGNSLTYRDVQYSGTGDDVTITANDANGTLNAGLADGSAISLNALANGVTDVVGVNNTVISGAATTSSKITRSGSDLAVRAGTAGNITVNGGFAALADRANATISAVNGAAAITAVTSLSAGGTWSATTDEVTLGNQQWNFSKAGSTLVADNTGAAAATVQFGGTATLGTTSSRKLAAESLSVNKAATWNLTGNSGDETAVFDNNGNVTLEGSNVTASLVSGKASSVVGANGGSLVLAVGGNARVENSNIVAANSLSAGSDWSLASTQATIGSGSTAQEWNFDNKGVVLTADNVNGTTINKVSGLTGNATLNYGEEGAVASLNIGETTWTSIRNDSDNIVVFDSVGSATISAYNLDAEDWIAQVFGSADASLKVVSADDSSAAMASVNGVYVAYEGDSNGLDFVLEARGTNAGISAINDVANDAKLLVYGDSNFSINNGAYTFANSGSGDADLQVTESKLVVNNLVTKDNVSVTGGDVEYTFDEGTSANVTLNGVGVSISSSSDTSNVSITGTASDQIATVSLKAGDTINTSSKDDAFTLYYDSSGVSSSKNYVLAANDLKVSVSGSDFSGSSATLNVSGSTSSTPYVTISGISNSAILSVTSGVYNIGKSAQVTISEATGYITLDSAGNATAEDESAAESRRNRESSITGAIDAAKNSTVTAFQFYYNMDAAAPTAVASSTVAGYDDAADTSPNPASVDGGINIYGNTKFSDKNNLHSITLQSAVSNAINIETIEGSEIWNSVIDVSGSARNTLVAIGTGNQSSAINHTVLGGRLGGIILFDENAVGDNYAQAGSVGTYLENKGGKATLLGGAGQDSILAGAGDYVSGGGGADYFYDDNGSSNAGGYVIRDYSITQGDIIVATKFSDINNYMTASELIDNVEVADSVIAIAGGSAITLGTKNSSVEGFDVVFADAAVQNTYNFAWAADGGGVVDASQFTDKGAVILSSQNGGMADSIIGTGDDDTIFAGGNDTVNPGNGNDEIYLSTIASEETGAVVVLDSKGTGRHDVHGFSFGFDNEDAGNSVLKADASSLTFKIQASTLVAYSGNNTVAFGGTQTVSGNKFDLLIGDADDAEKVSVLKSGANITVTANDDVADRYYAITNDATLTFASSVTDELSINLADKSYTNVSRIAVKNDNTATIVGSSGRNIVEISGAADADAHKSISLGGGDDVIYSGGASTATAGNIIYFGQNNDGDDTVNSFGFYQGVEADPDMDAADVLVLYGWTPGRSSITANANDSLTSIALNSNNTINIAGAVNPDNMIVYSLDNGATKHIAKIGVSAGQTNTFTYSKEVDYYAGNTNRGADTIRVDNSDRSANAEIWLDNSRGVEYEGIGVIDASSAQNTQLSLVGGYGDNTIISAGEGSTASLWGGEHGANSLIGGDSDDLFFFLKGDSNDTISNFDSANDRVRLFDVTLDDLASYDIDDDKISIALKAESGGGSLTIENNENGGIKVDVSNGNGTYTAYTATKAADGSWSWQNS